MNATLFASLAVTTLFQYLIYGGAIAVVAGGVMLWAVLFRKRRKHRSYPHHRDRSLSRAASAKSSTETDGAADNGERKRRRRSEPRRNPTLAETRGLPPIRGEESPPPEPNQY